MVSVIIPYYNPNSDTEIDRLLVRAVGSAVRELDGHTDFEVIVVNDGSPQAPSMSADCGDARIRFFERRHGRLGAARNTGIEHSKGDILTFLDADDFYLEGTLWPCIEAMRSFNADLLGFGFKVSHTWDGTERIKQPAPSFSAPVSGNDWMCRNNLFGSSCMYLIDRKLIADNGLRFLENLFIEDEEFTPRLVFSSRRYVHTSFKVYGYYRRNCSIITTMTEAAVREREVNTLIAITRLVEYRNGVLHESTDGLDRKIGTLAIDCIRRALQSREWRKRAAAAIAGLKDIGLYPVPTSSLPFGLRLYAGLSKCSPGRSLLHLLETTGK